jgi:SpoVK/Ycf46/Vps4 family AAA+-type ATPase
MRALAPETRDAAIEAAVGLSAEAAATCYSKSLVQHRCIDPAAVSAEKRRIVNQSAGVEWFEPDPRGLDAVGGLEVLKEWLARRKNGFSERARAFGLPAPKGVFLTGVPGCGKSLTAKATATAFGCPLLRADLGAAQSKWVGESQANIRKVFAVAESVGRCVLWIDEIEKALAGATTGAADGGVSADVLNVLLTWMQEKTAPVFVIATSNDVSKLPPELLRKGRFDDLFFVDLPTASERLDILRVTIGKLHEMHHMDPERLAPVVSASDGFTGSEVAELVTTALRVAFDEGEHALTVADLVKAANETVPLSKTQAEKLKELREWARTRARNASAAPAIKVVDVSEARKLDL